VHVAGHADANGFASIGGALDVEHLLATLGRHAATVRVVVLNACHTGELARQLSDHIDIVVGMRGELRDSSAKAFAEALYLTLGNGRSLAEAFEFAREQVRQRQGEDLAQLEAKQVDPNTLRLSAEAPPRARIKWALAAFAGLALSGATAALFSAASRPPTVADASLAVIGGGVLHRGSSEADAHDAYTECLRLEGERGLEACMGSFETSVFAREVGLGALVIAPFKLDRAVVTNERLAAWLNHSGQRVRVETDPVALARMKLPAPAVVFEDEWLVLVGAGGAPLDTAAAIVYRNGRFEVVAGRERHPARMISWRGAQLYCDAQGLRLPGSDEWEWAARGGRRRTFPWGERAPKDCSSVVYGRRPGLPCESRPRAPEPVGTSEDVTPEGVYDLGGNVSEWVATAFGPDDLKDIRGGHFEDSRVMLGSARRFRGHRSELYRQLGFRCAQSIAASVSPTQ
jgi:formylglycine-generating enzyme required for sulfatase activity